jgi:HAD superfamily hydrolase (TIGR01484 family)
MNYRILVLDLDGTLLNTQKRISAHTKTALMQYQKAGGRIVLASGRPTYGVEPLAKELKLAEYNGFILSFNGSYIIDCSTGRKIFEKTLPPNIPAVLYKLAKENKVNIITYDDDDNIITEDNQDIYVQEEARINHMNVKKVDSFIDYVNYPVAKCIMVEDGDYLVEVEKKVKAKVGDFLSVYRSETF